jgi:hypothetical protein
MWKILIVSISLGVTQVSHSQDTVTQQRIDQLEYDQQLLETEIEIQRYRHQVDRINARQRRGDDELDSDIDEWLWELERDGYKWDDDDE